MFIIRYFSLLIFTPPETWGNITSVSPFTSLFAAYTKKYKKKQKKLYIV